MRRRSEPGGPGISTAAAERARARAYMAGLPADRLPNIRRMGGRVLGGDADVRFELGLAALLDGLAAKAERTRKSAGGKP